ncbi:MAG: class I SAM-dependent methyltransferase, partial [Thermoleophilaceae bacterium]|nr:class I SAM-dependent methyltransferase [Thermoleophilaceae bacterium]
MTDIERAEKAISWLIKTYELPESTAPQFMALAKGSTEVPISGTAVASVYDACQTHLADSLAVLPLDLIPAGARLIDLGTGLGFPGLALATARPDISVVLADAVRKKVDAAAGLARAANLSNVECLWGRAEEIAAI